jgi:hypothetical protein
MLSVTGNMEDDCVALNTAEATCTAVCSDCQGNLDNINEMHQFWNKMKRDTLVYRCSGNPLTSNMLRILQHRLGSFSDPLGLIGLSMQCPHSFISYGQLALDLHKVYQECT